MAIDPIRTAFGLSNTYGLQRNYQTSQTALDRTLNRLSTGLRLNSAADDPVNFTRACNFETRALSTLQARENSQEAALLFQTASDGASSISGSLQRIRELALLSMTATTSSADRTGIQTEVDLLLGSIDRTAQTTTFNGRNLIGSTDAQTYLLGVETLGLVDSAIDTVNSSNSILGATQNVLNRTADYLADQQVNLTQALSDIQDANLEEELTNLDRHELVNQTAAAALSEARIQEERIFGILFGGSGFGRGGIF